MLNHMSIIVIDSTTNYCDTIKKFKLCHTFHLKLAKD